MMTRRYMYRWITVIVVALLVLANTVPALAISTDPSAAASSVAAPLATGTLDWFEPRGLSIVDLVGAVPDTYLSGSILSYTPGYGMLRYRSGQRTGNTVVITADVYPRYVIDGSWYASMFGCLGQPARIDQFGTVSPASTVRVYNGTTDVTRQVSLYSYVPSGLQKPIRNPQVSEWENQYRYWESALLSAQFTADGALILPGNMGCELLMSFKNYRQLTAVFTMHVPQTVSVQVMGTESFTFRSYLGPGYAGLIQPLVNQLSARFPDRHERFTLHVPEQADYLWVNYPAMPVDIYTQFRGNPTGNVDRPSSGTYRMNTSQGLSVDHVSSMGLPLRGHWKDMDLASGSVYLPYMVGASLAAPEYFVPTGVPYDPCMIQGTCSAALLDQIYTTPMSMQAIYLKVDRVSPDLQLVSLRMVGPSWDPAMVASIEETLSITPEPLSPATGATASFPYVLFLPSLLRNFAVLPPDSLCVEGPCGWLTSDGRMVDFVP